jgi:hypothetical protein
VDGRITLIRGLAMTTEYVNWFKSLDDNAVRLGFAIRRCIDDRFYIIDSTRKIRMTAGSSRIKLAASDPEAAWQGSIVSGSLSAS